MRARPFARASIAAVAVSTALASCEFIRTPFATDVHKFNEVGRQQPAAITVSDPQIYARETLINDRLRESKFLTRLLEEAENVKDFRAEIQKPELIRDVETLDAMRAALDLTIDPAKGLEFRRQRRLDDLDTEIQATDRETQLINKRTELVNARKKYEEALKAASGATLTETKSSDTGGGGTNPSAVKNDDQPAAADSAAPRAAAIIESLKNKISELEGQIDRVKGSFGDRKLTVSIPDAERTRDAYRTELRQRLNAVNLDDLHDYNGNALYRLQFRATVMPGEHKDKYGIARLTFLPPKLTDEDIDALYRTWLLHLAYRLNYPLPEARGPCPGTATALLRLGDSEIVKFYAATIWVSNRGQPGKKQFSSTKPPNDDKPCTIYVPLPPAGASGQIIAIERFSQTVLSAVVGLNSGRPADPELMKFVKGRLSLQGSAHILPDANLKAPPEFKKLLATYDTSSTAQLVVEKRESKPSDLDDRKYDTWDIWPQLTTSTAASWIAQGAAYAYTVAPLDKSQRLSTHAQAARSLEVALSVAAQVQAQGLSGGLNFGRVRESAGIAEAFESQPIVVGFADRNANVGHEAEGVGRVDTMRELAPQVGWVFGPKIRLDPRRSELQLIHGFAAHEVSADLSFPGWWPKVRMILETAWIGNLHNTGRPIRLEDENGQGFHRERFTVQLPTNAADLDGLTAYLAHRTIGASLPIIAIEHVEPFFLSACAQKIKILVKGANVWRSTRAFLGGVEAEDVTILPDMEGVALDFNLDTMFATQNKLQSDLGLEQGVRLAVWTRNGSDDMTLRLIGSRAPGGGNTAASCIARTTAAPANSRERLEIVDVTPNQICANADVAKFLVKAYSPEGSVKAIFGNNAIDTELVPAPAAGSRDTTKVLAVTFGGGPFGVANQSLPLGITDGKDISTTAIRLVNCTAKDAAEAPKPAPEVQEKHVAATEDAKTKNLLFGVTIKGVPKALVDNNLRVGVLPQTPDRADNWQWIASAKVPQHLTGTEDTYADAFAIDKNAQGNPQAAFGKSRALDFALVQKQATGPDKLVQKIKGKTIYYPSETEAQVRVSQAPTKLSLAEEPIVLTIPDFDQEAFPGLRKAKVKASVDKHAAAELVVDVDFSKVTGQKAAGTIKLKDPNAENEWRSAVPAGVQKVILSLEGSGIPKIAPFEITKQ